MLVYNIFDQGDHTVARLAWLLVNGPDTKMTIITHSRGTLQTRNALYIASLMGRDKRATQDVAWVAAAPVLTEREVLVRPDRFTTIINDGDLVSDGSRLTFRPASDYDDSRHDFSNYVPKIFRSMTY
jgi:hypothetical protein